MNGNELYLNENDVKALREIIQTQNEKGAHLPEDLCDACYRWDENGRLTGLMINRRGLSGELDLSGFPVLKAVRVSGNRLDALNITENLELTVLSCGGNLLEQLDVRQAHALTELGCAGNRLESLDISKNPSLRILYCGYNRIKELNLSANPELEELYCTQNALETLDTSKNPALTTLFFGDNPIRALDVSANRALECLTHTGSTEITGWVKEEEADYEKE